MATVHGDLQERGSPEDEGSQGHLSREGDSRTEDTRQREGAEFSFHLSTRKQGDLIESVPDVGGEIHRIHDSLTNSLRWTL